MNDKRYIPLLVSNGVFETKPIRIDKNDCKQQILSVDELRQCLADGHWVCPTASRECDIEHSNAAFVIIDIDGVQQDFVEFVECLRIEPTFAYTSYSHCLNDEEHQGKSRFRIVYVFNQPFSGKYYYGLYRHIGDKNKLPELGNNIINGKEHPIFDNLAPNQAYFGNPHAQWWGNGKTYNVPTTEKLEELAEQYADGWNKGNPVRVDFGLSDKIKKNFCDCITVTHFAKNHQAPRLTIYHPIEGTNYMQIEHGRRRVCSPRKLVNQRWGKWQHGDQRHNIILVSALSIAEQLDFQGDLTADNYLTSMARIYARDFVEDKKWDKRRFFSAIVSAWNAYHNGARAAENEKMHDVIVAYNAPKQTGKSKNQIAPTIRTYKRLQVFNPADYYNPEKSLQENYETCKSIYEQQTGGYIEYVSYDTFKSDIGRADIDSFSESEQKKEINDIMERYLWGVMVKGETVQRVRHGKGLQLALSEHGIKRDARTTRNDIEQMECLNATDVKKRMSKLRNYYKNKYDEEDMTFEETMMEVFDISPKAENVIMKLSEIQKSINKNDKKKEKQ